MKIIAFFICIFFSLGVQAQYTFSYTTAPYASLTSPISLNQGAVWDNQTNYLINLPFSFYVNGQSFTDIVVIAGGGINFPGMSTRNLTVFHSAFGGYKLKSKGATTSESPIDYEISGTTGHRIAKIQWANAGFRQSSPTPPDPTHFVDFQVWLFESDNHLEIRYGNSNTDHTTYGQSTPTANAGPSIKLLFDDCDNVLGLAGASIAPSASYLNHCSAGNYNHINGTPPANKVFVFNGTTTGIADSNELIFNAWPNPATDKITISSLPEHFGACRLVIANAEGKTVTDNAITTLSGQEYTVPLEHLPDGFYYLQVINQHGNRIVGKIVKAGSVR